VIGWGGETGDDALCLAVARAGCCLLEMRRWLAPNHRTNLTIFHNSKSD
jgi:hypothetical protein